MHLGGWVGVVGRGEGEGVDLSGTNIHAHHMRSYSLTFLLRFQIFEKEMTEKHQT